MAGTSSLDLEAQSRALEGRAPDEILGWAAEHFAPHIVFTTGFGVEGCVLIDLIARARLPITVLTLDTGVFFPETYALWRQLEERYSMEIRAVLPKQTLDEQAATHGPALWERDPDLCCRLRKIEPLAEAMAGRKAWVSAIRRDQTSDRGQANVLEHDKRFGIIKVNPLLSWTESDVWTFARANDVPFNPLHERGYPSIGCAPCTTPVQPGEDPRAGRWRGRTKTECGLHERARLPIVPRHKEDS
ncbi:MAG TPA: phosphoadenylyl-sulfate reductase [Polyangiaceae bacterium]